MTLKTLMPKIFYSDINTGLDFFVEGLGFKVTYEHNQGTEIFSIINRDSIIIQLVQNDEYAKKDRPEMRIITDDIETFYNEVSNKNPNLLHPNLKVIKQQPWGLTEFALLDKSGVCIIVQQEINDN